jgi:hypothetical protein
MVYHFVAGITFDLSIAGHTSYIRPEDKPNYHQGYWISLPISNALLTSQDVLVRQYRERCYTGSCAASTHQVTVMRAAIRKILLTPHVLAMSEVSGCEAPKNAHAVYIPQSAGVISPQNSSKLNLQVLMRRFAILTEGDELNVDVMGEVETGGGVFRSPQKLPQVVSSYQISFDGTNLRLHGADLAEKSPECFA